MDLGITATQNLNSNTPSSSSLQFAHTKSKHYIPDHKRTIELDAKNIKEAMNNFKAFHEELEQKSFESHHLIKMGALAKLCRQHFLLTGAPGNGKSFITDALLRITDEETNQLSFFSMQVNAETMADDLLGPVDYQRSMREGRMVRVVESGALAFNYGHIEEVFDAPFSLLRALLGLLYERKYRQGDRIFEGATESIGMTSNRYISDLQSDNEFFNPYQAFIDRIPFVAYVPEYFEEMSHYERMMKDAMKRRRKLKVAPFQTRLTCGDLDILQTLTEQVSIPKDVHLATVQLVENLNNQLNQLSAISEHEDMPFHRTKEYSKRSFVSLVSVIQSIVVYNKIFIDRDRSLVATIDDLKDLWFALALIGPSTQTIAHLLENNLFSNERERRQLLTVQREIQAFKEAFKQTKDNYKEHRTQEETQVLSEQKISLLKSLTIKPKLLTAVNIFNHLQETQSHLFTGIGEEKLDSYLEQINHILLECILNLKESVDFSENDLSTRLNTLEMIQMLCELFKSSVESEKINPTIHQYIAKTYDLIQHSFNFEVDDPFRTENSSNFYELPKLLAHYCANFETLKKFEEVFLYPANQTSQKLFQFLEHKIANSALIALKSLKFNTIERGVEYIEKFLKTWDRLKNLAFINISMPQNVSQTLDIHFSYELSQILNHPQLKSTITRKEIDPLLDLLFVHNIQPIQILWTLRNRLNDIHQNQLRVKNPKKLSYKLTSKDEVYQSYVNFQRRCDEYLSYIDLNQLKPLNKKYSKLCKKYLKEEPYFTFIANFEPYIIESTLIFHQITFLSQWFDQVMESLNSNRLISHDAIRNAIQGVQDSQFPEVIQTKEFFRIKEKLNLLQQLVPEDENSKKHLATIQKMMKLCTNIEQSYLDSVQEVIQAQSKLTLKDLQ